MVPGDILIVAHKVVSKSEGQVVTLAEVRPGPTARELAEPHRQGPGAL